LDGDNEEGILGLEHEEEELEDISIKSWLRNRRSGRMLWELRRGRLYRMMIRYREILLEIALPLLCYSAI